MAAPSTRPPSVDALARSLAGTGLPHPLLVDIARQAIVDGEPATAASRAAELSRTLLQPVVNASGVLLHTNLGRAPLAARPAAGATNLELDLATGDRGSRHAHCGRLVARLCRAEAGFIVNNNAAAILLVLAALTRGREVLVSRGESVEIGGGFRVPEVLEQSGARLVDVGTTNRTRLADYRRAIDRPGSAVAAVLKVHPSNYRLEGFVEATSVTELALLPVPVVVDIGSGLLDAACPWLPDGPPRWVDGEPAARQTLESGAALVTFSGDKLLGGPQAGIVAGRADLIRACLDHPLARALRPGALVLAALQDTLLAYLRRDVVDHVPFWRMATTPVAELRRRAEAIVTRVAEQSGTRQFTVAGRPLQSLPGAGSLPGTTIESYGVALPGDHAAALRQASPPIVARVSEGMTLLDLRTVDEPDDRHLVSALAQLGDG